MRNAFAAVLSRVRAPSRQKALAVGPIGIDLALEKMHLVQFQRNTDSSFSVRACASVAYPLTREDAFGDPNSLIPLIRSALGSDSFSGRQAVAALPGGSFKTMSLTYKVSPGQSDARALLALMQDRLDGEISDYVLDFIPVRSKAREAQRMALVAASKRSSVTAFLNALRKAGLTMNALEIGPVSVRRMINALPDLEADSNIIVVNTGRTQTYITALAGRRLLSDQAFAFGEDLLLQRLSDSLDMDPAAARDLVMRTGMSPVPRQDQVSVALNQSGIFNTLLEIIKPELMRLVAEIERAVLFTSSQTHGGKVSQVYLAGALAQWRGVTEALSSIIGFDVNSLEEPLRVFAGDNISDTGGPGMAVAIGLALRGLVDDA